MPTTGLKMPPHRRVLMRGSYATILVAMLVEAMDASQSVYQYRDGWSDELIAERVSGAVGDTITADSVRSYRIAHMGHLANPRRGHKAPGEAAKQALMATIEEQKRDLIARDAEVRALKEKVQAALQVVADLQKRINEEGRRLDRIETEVDRAKAAVEARDLRPAAVA